MKYLILGITLFLTSCATHLNVTDEHPNKDILLGEYSTMQELHLYKEENEKRYTILTSELTTYTYENEIQTEHRYPAEVTIPSGAKIIFSGIDLVSDMTSAQRTELIGILFHNNNDYPVSFIHEFLGIDLVQWQKENGIFSHPSTTDYLKNAKEGPPLWANSKNNKPNQAVDTTPISAPR